MKRFINCWWKKEIAVFAAIEHRIVFTYRIFIQLSQKRVIKCFSQESHLKINKVLLDEKEIRKEDLRKDLGLAPVTMTKLNQNEEVSIHSALLSLLCLGCNIGDICG